MKTKAILESKQGVDQYLEEIGLSREGILAVRDRAFAERNTATLFHARNAAGSLCYHAGVFALREIFVQGDEWKSSCEGGMELIRNKDREIVLGFCNVDEACNPHKMPKSCSKKGTSAERLSVAPSLFEAKDLPQTIPPSKVAGDLYYVMVAKDGAVEVSCPVILGGTFIDYRTRLLVDRGFEITDNVVVAVTSDDEKSYDPVVVKKSG